MHTNGLPNGVGEWNRTTGAFADAGTTSISRYTTPGNDGTGAKYAPPTGPSGMPASRGPSVGPHDGEIVMAIHGVRAVDGRGVTNWHQWGVEQRKAMTDAARAAFTKVGRPELLDRFVDRMALIADAPAVHVDAHAPWMGHVPRHALFLLERGVELLAAQADREQRETERIAADAARVEAEQLARVAEREADTARAKAKAEATAAELVRTAPWRALQVTTRVAVSAALQFPKGAPERRALLAIADAFENGDAPMPSGFISLDELAR